MTNEIIRFHNKAEYEEWLSHRSLKVQMKAKEFAEKYGSDVVPIILSLDTDTYGEGGGCHVFIHPAHADVLSYIVF